MRFDELKYNKTEIAVTLRGETFFRFKEIPELMSFGRAILLQEYLSLVDAAMLTPRSITLWEGAMEAAIDARDVGLQKLLLSQHREARYLFADREIISHVAYYSLYKPEDDVFGEPTEKEKMRRLALFKKKALELYAVSPISDIMRTGEFYKQFSPKPLTEAVLFCQAKRDAFKSFWDGERKRIYQDT